MGISFFSGFQVLFFIAFFAIMGGFVITVIRGIMTWNQNNHSPRLTVAVTAVAKRISVSHHQHSSTTAYYVTFEVESGDRMELRVPGGEYGQIVEGDRGQLTFQGTRFLMFERKEGI